jgi:hypothetical protein
LTPAVIVWISPEFRDEHREAIDWLNRHTSENAEFYGVALELREKHRFTNSRLAQPRHFYSFSSGVVPGIVYTAAFPSGARLRAELYIDFGDASKNKAVFDWLLTLRTEIESATGPLDWERLDQKRASRISLVRPNTTMEDANIHSAAMRAWLVQALLNLKAVFGPRLMAAAQAATARNQPEVDPSELSSSIMTDE